MKGKALVVVVIALILLGFILGLDAISNRPGDIYGDQEKADLMPMWIVLGAIVVTIVAYAIVNHVPRAGRTAPPYLGQQASMPKGEINKTTEKAGEMKRVGGEF